MAKDSDCSTPKILLCANTPAELPAELARLDVDVPQRSAGRTTHHVERYCIAHLLATVPAARFSFPLMLIHGDRPDFVLAMRMGHIGIEHTEAVSENVARAQTLREREVGPSVYFTPRATPGEPRKHAAELRAEIEANEAGDGWAGDSAEREWAAAIVHYVKEKLSKATAAGFVRYPENWLVVYDNWPLPDFDLERAASFLSPLLECIDAFTVFDTIFVHTGSQICEFRKYSDAVIHDLGLREAGS